MKGFDVLKVKSAVKARNKMNLPNTHLTTMNFGEIVPLRFMELVPSDEVNCNAHFFSRLAPLVVPTYGKFSFKTIAGFVPWHMIAVDAEAWIAGKTTWEGQTPKHRYFTLTTLHGFIVSKSSTEGATADNCDYAYKNESETVIYRRFTKEGKYYIKVLNALGYSLPSGVNLKSSSGWVTRMSQKKLSAYPLLAFFKLYNDYMSQSQRFNTSILSSVLYSIKYGTNTTYWDNSTGELNTSALNAMFANLKLCYENDYFTSAWQSANSPLADIENVTSITVPESGTTLNSITDALTSTYATVNGSTNPVRAFIPQRTLDFLKSFDNWVRRNNYSGSRVVQQIFSRMGIKTSDYRDHYAHIITTDEMPIQVGDVTATAESNDVPLGDYAGKGIMSGNKPFSYKADDYGILIVLGYFTVTPMNPYGFDRTVLRTEPLDFYNPEFDGLGADAISVGEYFANPIDTDDPTYDDNTFGFTERYNSYRYSRDMITGEFRNYHENGMMNAWHTGRLLNKVRHDGYLLAQNSAVNTMPQTESEYNRIFNITDGANDTFYLTANFELSAIRPMMNLNQVVNLGEGDTVVPRNGNVIS